MDYPEYTKCATPQKASDHKKEGTAPWGEMIAAGISVAMLWGGLSMLALAIAEAVWKVSVSGWSYAGVVALALLLGAVIAIIIYCNWWLNYRLICLDDDNNHCVIGFVAELPPPEKGFFGQFDTDFTMNIGIYGTWFGDDDLDKASMIKPYGYLLKSSATSDPNRAANDKLTKFGFNLAEGPRSPGDDKSSPYFGKSKMQVLHVEFEGGAVYALRNWLYALSLLLLAALAASVACASGLLWACLVLYLLLGLFAGLGYMTIPESLSHKANPADIDKALGDLAVGNIVVVTGRWVYDAGHVDENRGWNEIHPIRYCQILQKKPLFNGPPWPPLGLDQICNRINAAASALVKAEQEKPEHGWEIHPLVDGCRGEVAIFGVPPGVVPPNPGG